MTDIIYEDKNKFVTNMEQIKSEAFSGDRTLHGLKDHQTNCWYKYVLQFMRKKNSH